MQQQMSERIADLERQRDAHKLRGDKLAISGDKLAAECDGLRADIQAWHRQVYDTTILREKAEAALVLVITAAKKLRAEYADLIDDEHGDGTSVECAKEWGLAAFDEAIEAATPD